MLTLNRLSSKTRYHVRGQQSIYDENQPGERPGVFMGRAAAALDLDGNVTSKTFAAVMEGFDPCSGKKLVRNAGQPNRPGGWDLVFSPDKSVSVAWVTADADGRAEIEAALQETVQEFIDRIEEVIRVRVGSSSRLVAADPLFSVFLHTQNRSGEPQLHVHIICHNLAITASGKWGAVDSRVLYARKMAWGALMRADFAVALEKRLPGIRLISTADGFRLEGIPDRVVQHFSQRRREILAEMDNLATNTARAKELATLKTRKRKERAEPFAQLRNRCIRESKSLGWNSQQWHERMRKRPARSPRPKEETAQKAFEFALKKLFHRQSHVSQFDLMRFAANFASGRGLSGREVERDIAERIQQQQEIELAGRYKGQPRYTTPEVLQQESDLLQLAGRLVKRRKPGVTAAQLIKQSLVGNAKTLQRFMRRESDRELTPGQRKIVNHLVGDCGQLTLVNHAPVQDIDTVVSRCAEYYAAAGYQVITATRSARRAAERDFGPNVDSRTLTSLLQRTRRDNSVMAAVQHAAKQLVRQAVGKRIGLFPYQWKSLLTEQSVVLIDGAESLSTQDTYDLLTAARRSGAKLALIGCDYQQKSLERGAPFRMLSEQHSQWTLTDAPRDRCAARRVQQIMRKESLALIEDAQRSGNLYTAHTRKTALDKLVDDWFARGGPRNPFQHMVAANHADEVAYLNQQISDRCSTRYPHPSTEYRVANGERLREGDCFVLTSKCRSLNQPVGRRGLVISKSLLGLRVVFEDGTMGNVRTSQFHARRGFALLPHQLPKASQHVYMMLGGQNEDMLTAAAKMEVAADHLRLYCDYPNAGEDLQQLCNTLQWKPQSKMASELRPTIPRNAESDRNQIR
ncbi:MAG: relaxase domain-containing protein [Planctomycetales bacterium]|nr:relaxase domain-containing protein [Planctomycetales bacterium]